LFKLKTGAQTIYRKVKQKENFAFATDEEAAASKRMELYVFSNIQETSQQSYKTQIRILPWLA